MTSTSWNGGAGSSGDDDGGASRRGRTVHKHASKRIHMTPIIWGSFLGFTQTAIFPSLADSRNCGHVPAPLSPAEVYHPVGDDYRHA